MQRSHSRSSYPFDKPHPFEPFNACKYKKSNRFQRNHYTPTSTQRQVEKKMHAKKQRQHNNSVCYRAIHQESE